MKQRDARMNLVSETLQAIRAIKLHAWEGAFEQAIGVAVLVDQVLQRLLDLRPERFKECAVGRDAPFARRD